MNANYLVWSRLSNRTSNRATSSYSSMLEKGKMLSKEKHVKLIAFTWAVSFLVLIFF
jgi:hypothetical protein